MFFDVYLVVEDTYVYGIDRSRAMVRQTLHASCYIISRANNTDSLQNTITESS